MKRIINHRKGQCTSCGRDYEKKFFIKKKGSYFCKYCGYCNSESIFKEYKEVEVPKLVFGIDTQETLKKKLNNKK